MAKEDRINLRVTEEQRARWEQAAKIERRPLADWIRIQLDDGADLVIEAAEALTKGQSGSKGGKSSR